MKSVPLGWNAAVGMLQPPGVGPTCAAHGPDGDGAWCIKPELLVLPPSLPPSTLPSPPPGPDPT